MKIFEFIALCFFFSLSFYMYHSCYILVFNNTIHRPINYFNFFFPFELTVEIKLYLSICLFHWQCDLSFNYSGYSLEVYQLQNQNKLVYRQGAGTLMIHFAGQFLKKSSYKVLKSFPTVYVLMGTRYNYDHSYIQVQILIGSSIMSCKKLS